VWPMPKEEAMAEMEVGSEDTTTRRWYHLGYHESDKDSRRDDGAEERVML
jgi:hypothetical protein